MPSLTLPIFVASDNPIYQIRGFICTIRLEILQQNTNIGITSGKTIPATKFYIKSQDNYNCYPLSQQSRKSMHCYCTFQCLTNQKMHCLVCITQQTVIHKRMFAESAHAWLCQGGRICTSCITLARSHNPGGMCPSGPLADETRGRNVHIWSEIWINFGLRMDGCGHF